MRLKKLSEGLKATRFRVLRAQSQGQCDQIGTFLMFLAHISKYLVSIWTISKNIHIFSKKTVATFSATFKRNWATFIPKSVQTIPPSLP